MSKPARKRPLGPLDPLRPLPAGLSWYVLTTSPQREYVVARWLEDRGWHSLVPLDKRWKLSDPKRGGKKQERTAYMLPLLPRMVIAGFHVTPPWLTILDHQHIHGVLGVDHTPVALRRGEPELLQAISHALVSHKPSHSLAPGGKALVTAPGPLQGQLVEVGTVRGKKAIIAAVFNQFGRQALPFVMEAMVEDLEAA